MKITMIILKYLNELSLIFMEKNEKIKSRHNWNWKIW